MQNKIAFFEVQPWEKKILKNAFPEALFYEEQLTVETVKLSKDADIISVFIYSTITAELCAKLPHVRFIATRSTGFDHIDVPYCTQHNILVSNVPEYGSNTVAEHTFALILSLSRKIYQSVNQAKQLNFDHAQIRGTDLNGKTLGIIGLGKIGLNVLRIANGFGMNVIVSTHSKDILLQESYDFEYVTIDELVESSDFISLHLPLTKETKHIINNDRINKMKMGTFLINTARGGLVDTKALIAGINSGKLAGVALDVLEEEKEMSEEAEILTPEFRKEADMETLVINHYLMANPKVLITPHNAFNSVEALKRIDNTTVENIRAFLDNSPINTVNK
ncbi:MAG: NAD(P)-dependent oxidoreductase [Candidatus Roizmanbacteria bacterium]|nr:NAD(P)-dependent oxidoreductase [Candidatus Roizmanbacteria bacterium]